MSAGNDTIPPPTPEQVAIVKSTAPVLAVHGVAITTAFYENIHRDVPAVAEIFNQTNQKNGHQARALAHAVHAYASYIDNLAVLSTAVEHICQKHASILIHPTQYGLVGQYLLAAIKQVLGDAATDDIISAWAAAYWQLANLMIAREAQIYQEKNNSNNETWREFTVEKKVKESDDISSFYLRPKDGKALEAYLPGQYISLRVDVPQDVIRQSRQYSLSQSPNPELYRISVKRIDANETDPEKPSPAGLVSNILHSNINEGDSIDLTFPCGDFFLDTANTTESNENPVVLISAGVGVTPVMAIMDSLAVAEESSEKPVTWIHATRSSAVHAFVDYTKKTISERSNWRAVVFKKDGDLEEDGNYKVLKGRIDLPSLNKSEDLHISNENAQYFVCGPDSFMVDVQKTLIDLGVAASQIKSERFATGSD